MSDKFQGSIQHGAEVSYVKLLGIIDEDNTLGELVDKIPGGTAVIDLGEIERINSCGVRDWVNWLAKIEANGARPVLVECSPAIVAQINLVNNFTGSGVVKSFYVPYWCQECDEEKVLLVEAAEMGPPPHEPPTCRCDECDLVMDFDDMPDSYFAFLSNQRKLAEPDKINGAIRELGRDDAKKLRSLAAKPSMPSISRTSAGARTGTGSAVQPMAIPSTAPVRAPGSRPPGALPMSATPGLGFAPLSAPPAEAPSRGNALVVVLILILVAAIGVLAYLVLTK